MILRQEAYDQTRIQAGSVDRYKINPEVQTDEATLPKLKTF